MLLNLFYLLRGLGVGVSATEWLTLMRGLDKGLHNDCLEDFYYLSRSLLIKDVAHYDAFDQAFTHLFQGAAVPDNSATRTTSRVIFCDKRKLRNRRFSLDVEDEFIFVCSLIAS